MVALRGQSASSHPATSLLDLNRSPELNHAVWPPLTLNLSACRLVAPRHGDPRRGVGSGAGRVRNGEPVERATGPNGPKGQRRARSLWFVVVIQLFGLWRHGGAPRGRVRRDRTRPRPRDGPCRGRWTMPRLVRGPRTAVRSSLRAPQPCSLKLHPRHHTPPSYITPFRIRSEFAGRSHHAYFSDERHNNKEVLPP